MKKILAFLCCALATYAGLWLALIAEWNDNAPLDQGAQAIGAAILFAAALLFAGWGNSLNWKGGRKNG